MKKLVLLAMVNAMAVCQLHAQVDAGLFRYPDVSKTQIVFSYANDLWIVPKEGGTAVKMSSPPGLETYPKFSPDGSRIAFTGNYDGISACREQWPLYRLRHGKSGGFL